MAFFRSPSCARQALLLIAIFAWGTALVAEDTQAESLLKQGRVDEAAAILNQALAANAHDGRAHQLLCRVYYSQDMADSAIHECEHAVEDDPASSDSQVWLGRAYGMKASQINMLSAFGFARKLHTAFEHAVQLNPANVQAMSDLGQFYVAAPAIVGGGLDKAQDLVPQLMPRSAQKAHRLLAMIAKKKKDLVTAEAEYKSAVAAGKSPDALVDLGQFYQEQSQPDKAVAALEASIQTNRARSSALVDAASILTDLQRRPDLAEKALHDYLSSPAKTDEAPAFKVHLQLADILKKRGDTAGAQREYAAAQALASNFVPARKAVHGG
ncbi:tetratricopeptide repeat protein [Edaphobacter modestus]|uniref:Tetratricopeptide repeat protein n=1 Tax=Edaphobacter modestus TaxID=388466 RepID=A0A4Q7Z049_9BACT|nr:tetratricopeptide repeat protein [Edaphobacter modestus]RZU43510.1 tetratricopeptide repeat protein [Edaphobacter modestus]